MLLPPDQNGTRHAGWVLIPQVAGQTTAKPEAPPAKKTKKDKQSQASTQDDQRVAKAKRELDQAREQYEKAVRHGEAAASDK